MLFWTGGWFSQDPVIPAKAIGYTAEWMNTFLVYAFVLISGYIFYYQKYENGKYQKFSPFLCNKTKRLLVPALFVGIVWAIPIGAYYYQYDLKSVIDKFVLAKNPVQLWFLFMLFDVFAVFYLLSDLMKNRLVPGAVVIALLYGAGLVWNEYLPNVFQIGAMFRFLPLFWIGFKIRQYGSGILRKIPALVYIAADIGLFIGLRYLPQMNTLFLKLMENGLFLALNILGALMAFVTLEKIAGKIRRETAAFRFFKKNSMTIYLFHQQIIYVMIDLLNGLVNPYLHVLINFSVSLAGASLLSLLLSRTKVTRFLIGEK